MWKSRVPPVLLTASVALSGAGFVSVGMPLLLCVGVLFQKSREGLVRAAKQTPKYIWACMGTLLLSAAVHAAIGHGRDDVMGLIMSCCLPVAYLLGKQYGRELRVALAILGVILAVVTIEMRIIDPSTTKPAGMVAYHVTVFLVLAGMLLMPKEWKWWRAPLWTVMLAGVAMSGSEEGLVGLAIVSATAMMWLWREIAKRDSMGTATTVVLVTMSALLLLLMTVVGADAYYPNLREGRAGDMNTLLDGRWNQYVRAANMNWVTGEGWYWEAQSRVTLHNVPFRVATQYGIPAALAWLGIAVGAGVEALRRRDWMGAVLVVVILWFSVIDHLTWTWLGLGTMMILGLTSRARNANAPLIK